MTTTKQTTMKTTTMKTTQTTKRNRSRKQESVGSCQSTRQPSRKVELSTNSADEWFGSNRTRPKDFVVHFTRTANGYRVRAAKALVRKNQYSAQEYPINVQSIVPDMTRLGITS